jgi:acetyl-CoA carboxylase biotin carboxylase subunit
VGRRSLAMPPITKVLVANRGEIARRVFRTCRERGIATVAVYSAADRGAPHVCDADEAVEIGPAAARESYLRVDRIVDAARRTGADAIHPGYGFLSEKPELVAACLDAGIVFVGPPVRAMEVMGDKIRSREAMTAAGVPVVPGVEDVRSLEAARDAAAAIGFPVMVKASAGGGGKGMRIVHRAEDLQAAYEGAAREAEAAFGDGRLFVERAVLRARHVEIQVMADTHGEVVHLGERDCSVQRRHQKVIEESPSSSAQMGPEVRAQMGDVATRAARAVGYVGAGTVEFLFEETEAGPRFYFLEMNTRLQVEHPVTEAVTGRDLVWDQLRVASGEPLGYRQADVHMQGHAVECRIYAEDPHTFLPRPGPVRVLRWPCTPCVRIDAAVEAGAEVSSHYDPMIAKVVAWGPDRATAIARMRAALADTVILGLETNLELHHRVLGDPDFCAGRITTRFLDEHPSLLRAGGHAEGDLVAAVAAAAAISASARSASTTASDAPRAASTAWRRAARWRT